MKTIKINIINKIAYWHHKLKLSPIYLKQNNRMKWSGFISYNNNLKHYLFEINFKNLLKKHKILSHFIFHEFGHIYYNTPIKYKNEVTSEYLAEKYALKMIKKYCPKLYKPSINYLKTWLIDKKHAQKFPAHAKAFKKIIKELIY